MASGSGKLKSTGLDKFRLISVALIRDDPLSPSKTINENNDMKISVSDKENSDDNDHQDDDISFENSADYTLTTE